MFTYISVILIAFIHINRLTYCSKKVVDDHISKVIYISDFLLDP